MKYLLFAIMTFSIFLLAYANQKILKQWKLAEAGRQACAELLDLCPVGVK